MGTRGLTAVMFDGQYRIAQYGQWDHYPGGQGLTALEFCRKWLTDPVKSSQFVSNMLACRWVTDEDINKGKEAAGLSASSDGWMTDKQAEKFNKVVPLLTRDHGAGVLEKIAEEGGGVLRNEIDFAGDSLFCEYAYVIDMDKGTFEVYKGFNDKPVAKTERFANSPHKEGKKYYPVKLWKQWKLDDLPSKSAFLEAFKENDE